VFSFKDTHKRYCLDLQVGVLIIGAGPTGLGAATRLHQHGLKDWLLIDQVKTATMFFNSRI
jgi:thioredoxin reductase